MNQLTDKLLQELEPLFQDSGLSRPDWEKLIDRLVAARPNVTIDQNFKATLKAQLLSKFDQPRATQTNNLKNIIIKFKTMNKILWTAGGLAVVTLLVVVGLQLQLPTTGPTILEPQVIALGDHAFGDLSGIGLTNTSVMPPYIDSTAPADTLSPEAADLNRVSADALPGYGGGGSGSTGTGIEVSIPPYEPTVYTFKYQGEPLELNDQQLPVLKRLKRSGQSASALLQSVTFPGIDLNKLGGQLQTFTLSQNQPDGYDFYVDLLNGELSIGQNWQVQDGPLPSGQPINILADQYPPDEQLLQLASVFIDRFGIDLGAYGQPFVDQSYYQPYAVNLKPISYQPYANVIYPLQLNGLTVYDEGSHAVGLNISLDLSSNRLTNLNGLTTQQYQSSIYEMETTPEAIIKLAEQGGIYPIYPSEEPGLRTIQLNLGTPQMAYEQLWSYGADYLGTQLYVPALVFPITNKEAAQYWSGSIIIPLAKEIIQQRQNPIPPEPLPLDRPLPVEPQPSVIMPDINAQ